MAEITTVTVRTTTFTKTPQPKPQTQKGSDVKTKQIWLNSAAAGGLLAGGLVLCAGSALSLLSLPLFGAAYYCRTQALSLLDYEDPKVIEKLREEAQNQSIPDLVKNHGWEKIFRYEILSPAQFAKAYRTHADTLRFPKILDLYDATKEGLDTAQRQAPVSSEPKESFSIPLPTEWKSKFEAETKHTRCDRILNEYAEYPISKLKTFAIISDNQAAVLDEVASLQNGFFSTQSALEQEFIDKTPHQHTALHQAKQIAELTYQSHPSHALLSGLELEENRRILEVRNRYRPLIQQEQSDFEQFEHMLVHHGHHYCPVARGEEIFRRRQQMDATITRLKNHRNREFWNIESDVRRQKTAINHSIRTAKQLRDLSYSTAQEQFRRDTAGVRKEIDAKKAAKAAEFEQQVGALEIRYRAPAV